MLVRIGRFDVGSTKVYPGRAKVDRIDVENQVESTKIKQIGNPAD